jgi:hypothetical protein
MKGFKGFDRDLKCRGFQYEVGKSITHPGKVSLCNKGLHFCENPLDVFDYYDPTQRFAEVEADGVSDETSNDSKRVAKTLHIKAEISLVGMIQCGVKFILDKVDFANAKESNTGDSSAATNTGDSSAATNTGDRSAATNTGDRSAATNTGDRSAATNTGYSSAATNTGYSSAATNTGDRSAATNTGDRSAATNTGDRSAATNTGDSSAATNTGKEGCAISIGIEGRASGAVGCWLTLAEWKQDEKFDWHRISVKTALVDGKKIKADTFYQLKNGKFIQAS